MNEVELIHLRMRLVGQAVKTPPSHGGNRGSIPLRAVDCFITAQPWKMLETMIYMVCSIFYLMERCFSEMLKM